MARGWWYDVSLPAARGLHRALGHAVGAFVALVGAASLAWFVVAAPPGRAAWVTGVCAAAVVLLGAVIWTGRRGWWVPTAMIVASTTAEAWGTGSPGSVSPLALYTVTGVLLLLPTQLRPRPVAVVSVVIMTIFVVAAAPDERLFTIDLNILNLGMVVAATGFLRLLFASAAEVDDVAEQRRAVDVQQAVTAAELAHLAEVRQILHDDVMGSLLLLGHGRLDDESARDRARLGLDGLRRAGVIA